MAVKQLKLIIEQTILKFELFKVAVYHHLGSVPPLESGVIGWLLLFFLHFNFYKVSVSSKHRAAAFNGCEEVMNRLKSEVPIWKKEIYGDGSCKWIHNCAGCKTA